VSPRPGTGRPASPRAVSIAFQTDHPRQAHGPLAAAEAHGVDGVSVHCDLLFQPA
jgi:hypothetical protein